MSAKFFKVFSDGKNLKSTELGTYCHLFFISYIYISRHVIPPYIHFMYLEGVPGRGDIHLGLSKCFSRKNCDFTLNNGLEVQPLHPHPGVAEIPFEEKCLNSTNIYN